MKSKGLPISRGLFEKKLKELPKSTELRRGTVRLFFGLKAITNVTKGEAVKLVVDVGTTLENVLLSEATRTYWAVYDENRGVLLPGGKRPPYLFRDLAPVTSESRGSSSRFRGSSHSCALPP